MSSIRLQNIAPILRPRERLLRYGIESLNSEELIAILLRSGKKGTNVLSLAKNVLETYPLHSLSTISVKDLTQISGIGTAKATQLMAGIELGKRLALNHKSTIHLTPSDIFEALPKIRKSRKEHFVIFFLDARNQEIKKEIISIGTVDSSLVHPREVFEPAIQCSASQIVLVHNHPSNNSEPSEADIVVTKKLVQAGEILGISVVDHVIVTSDSYFSFNKNSML